MRESCNRTKKEWSEPAVRRPRGLILAAVLAAAVFAADAAERWRVHPLSLPRGARLVLYDIKMLSTSQGIATGYLSVGSEIYPTSLITADGGRRWTFAETPEAGRALFFVGQRTGWMVAAALALGPAAGADTVELKNGDRISGSILQCDGKLLVHTSTRRNGAAAPSTAVCSKSTWRRRRARSRG